MTFVEFAKRYYVKVYEGDVKMENFDRDRDVQRLKMKIMERLAMIVQNPYFSYDEILKNMLSVTGYEMMREGELEYIEYEEHRKQQLKKNKEQIKEKKTKGKELLAKREEVKKELDKYQGDTLAEQDDKTKKELEEKYNTYTESMRKLRRLIKTIRNRDLDEVVKVFDDVTQADSNLYMYLLDAIEPNSNEKSIFQCLKYDKWWVVDENIRKEILILIKNVVEERKWLYLRKNVDFICYKMLKPYEYYIKSNVEWMSFNYATLDRPKKDINENEYRLIVDYVSELKEATRDFMDDYYEIMKEEEDIDLEEFIFGNSDDMWCRYNEFYNKS